MNDEESKKIVNLFPVNDVYALYDEDGEHIAYKVPFLALYSDGDIEPLEHGFCLEPSNECQNFVAYGTKESLKAEFSKYEIEFVGEKRKPTRRMTAERDYEVDVCPVCGHILMDERNDHFNFCPDCGQAIDWSA